MATRQYKKTYSITLTYKANVTYTASQKVYLPPTPFLKETKIDAISYTPLVLNFPPYSANIATLTYLTIVDKNLNQRLTNYPMYDLYDGFHGVLQNSPFRLRLFNIDGVNTEASYFLFPGTGITSPFDIIAGYLNFYSES